MTNCQAVSAALRRVSDYCHVAVVTSTATEPRAQGRREALREVDQICQLIIALVGACPNCNPQPPKEEEDCADQAR